MSTPKLKPAADVSMDAEHQAMRERALAFDDEIDGTGVVMAEAFVRGMRDIGYKNTAYALNEIIDNSIEARASSVYVELLEGRHGLEAVAIVDDGMGMPKEWLRHSLRWGASHRDQQNLKGFGRFGYGLKSAAISFARRLEVYSRIPQEATWSMAYLDVGELSAGTYRTENGQVGVPPAKASELPAWLIDRLLERGVALSHGTAVVLSKIDSDRVRTRADSSGATDVEKIRSFLMEQFGLTYRNYISQSPIKVDGRRVDPIDPLFITPGSRFYDVDEDLAEPLPPMTIAVKTKDKKGIAGEMRCRFSLMPPTFLRKKEHKAKADGDGRGSAHQLNERFAIRRDHNGIIILRAGRQIDVASRTCPWTVFVNNDRYIGVEVDFDPGLDSEFSVPTSKQQVVPSRRIWDILEENGVADAIEDLRKRYKQKQAKFSEEFSKKNSPEQQPPNSPEMTPSELAMASAEKFAIPAGKVLTLEQTRRAEEEFKQVVEAEAKKRGVPSKQIAAEKEQQAKVRPYKIALEARGAQSPYFRATQEGGQKVLYINSEHRFYMDVYAKTDGIVRFGLEAMLFSIGFHWIRSGAEKRTFYESEVVQWSVSLNTALSDLENYDHSH